jgi:5-aminopentanamidase
MTPAAIQQVELRDEQKDRPMTSVRVAALQMDPAIGETDRNLERIERLARRAAYGGALLAVAPECAVTGYAFDSLD